MQVTSAEAAKLLRKLNDTISGLTEQEGLRREYVAAVGEDPESVRPDYSYTDTRDELLRLEASVRKVKHALNVFNSTQTVPGFGITIDEMLILLPQLSARKSKLAAMKARLPKVRDMSYRNTAILDYRYINYELSAVEADYEAVSDELARAQMALDEVNSTVRFEISDI